MQCDLSCRQACWQEFLSQSNFKIIYIKGDKNTVADSLSCLDHDKLNTVLTPILSIGLDAKLLEDIKWNYAKDEWCMQVRENMDSVPECTQVDGLLY